MWFLHEEPRELEEILLNGEPFDWEKQREEEREIEEMMEEFWE